MVKREVLTGNWDKIELWTNKGYKYVIKKSRLIGGVKGYEMDRFDIENGGHDYFVFFRKRDIANIVNGKIYKYYDYN